MNSNIFFEKTPPTKLFFMAAIPGSIGMLASAFYQFLDGIFVSRILGEVPFAALNLALPFVIINFSLADLVGIGSSVPISIRLGEKNEKEANNIFSIACILITGLGVLIGILMYLAAPFLIAAIGAEGALAQDAVVYLRVYAVCSPVTTIVFAVDNYMRICGKIRRSMILNIIMSVLSAFLEFTFLYFFHWGIGGAALATCIGMAASTIIAFYPFFRGKMQLCFCRPHFNVRIIKQILICGTPGFLGNVAGRIASILINTILLRLGGATAVSVYGILMYVDAFVQPLLYGMCDSIQPAVGYNWGARLVGRVKSLEKRCYAACLTVSAAAAALVFFFPDQLITLFAGKSGDEYRLLAKNAIILFSTAYFTRWISFATISFLSAIEKSVHASIISLMSSLIFPVLVLIVLFPAGLPGVWLNLSVTSLLSAILSIVLMKINLKKAKLQEI